MVPSDPPSGRHPALAQFTAISATFRPHSPPLPPSTGNLCNLSTTFAPAQPARAKLCDFPTTFAPVAAVDRQSVRPFDHIRARPARQGETVRPSDHIRARAARQGETVRPSDHFPPRQPPPQSVRPTGHLGRKHGDRHGIPRRTAKDAGTDIGWTSWFVNGPAYRGPRVVSPSDQQGVA